MKKPLLSLILAMSLVAPMSAFGVNAAQAASFPTNTAIRGQSTTTVYWYATDGKRYVFPNASVFYSWFPNFNSVRYITDSELYSITVGGNVTYRPGSKLVKIPTDPKVYAVSRGGVLRHVTTPNLATQLYGADWNKKLIDVDVAYFTNYTLGAPIYNAWEYDVNTELYGVSTPSDSMRGVIYPAYPTNTNATLTLTADRTSINAGNAVSLTSHYVYSMYGTTIKIREVNGGDVKTLCGSDCSVTIYPTQTKTYVAEAWTNGATHFPAWLAYRSNEVTVYVTASTGSSTNGTNYINGLVLNADRTNINPGNVVRLSANAFNAGSWSYAGNRITITDMRTGLVVKTCYDVATCVVDVYPQAYSSTNLTAQYQAKIYDRTGVLAMSQYSPVIYLTSYAGTTTGTSYGYGYDYGYTYSYTQTTGRGLTTVAPTENLRTNQMIYITGTFTDTNIPLEDAVVKIYTERSASPIATCTGSRTCSVSYPTGADPINTLVFARLSSRSLTYTTLESNKASLVTTR